MGERKVEPGPYITFENVLCEWEQRNGQTTGLRERLVCLSFEKQHSTVAGCLDLNLCFATFEP